MWECLVRDHMDVKYQTTKAMPRFDLPKRSLVEACTCQWGINLAIHTPSSTRLSSRRALPPPISARHSVDNHAGPCKTERSAFDGGEKASFHFGVEAPQHWDAPRHVNGHRNAEPQLPGSGSLHFHLHLTNHSASRSGIILLL